MFDIVPQYQPDDVGKVKGFDYWTKTGIFGGIHDMVTNLHFLSVYDTKYRGDWVTIDKKDDKTGRMNLEECCLCQENLLSSLRGAFLMSMLLGAKDRHMANIGISDECTIMNIDYGHFLGHDRSDFGYFIPIPSVLTNYLNHALVGNEYLKRTGVSSTKLKQLGIEPVASLALQPRCSGDDHKLKSSELEKGYRWNLTEVLIASLFQDVQALRRHFQGPFVSDDVQKQLNPTKFKKSKYKGKIAVTSKWSAFWSNKQYFKSPDFADKWLSVTKKTRDSLKNAIDYMSYVLFGNPGTRPKVFKNKFGYFERLPKGQPEAHGDRLGKLTKKGYEEFREQVFRSVKGEDDIVKNTWERWDSNRRWELELEKLKLRQCE